MTETLQSDQFQRIQYLHHVCNDKELFRNLAYKKTTSNKSFYFSKKYNFTYCLVPKAGSTFWTQATATLEQGSNAVQSVIAQSRNLIHQRVDQTLGSLQRHIRSILVVRDPYSRLYSAFVDKFMLPTAVAFLTVKGRGKEYTCASDITFEKFLTFIYEDTFTGKTLNRHWAPIYSICSPCDVNVLALVKMKTFSADVKFALKQIKITDDEFDAISTGLHSRRVEWTIPSLVQGLYDGTNKAYKTNCANRTVMAERIWLILQIQGFIKSTIKFPYAVVNTEQKASNVTFLIDVILKTIKEHPLTSEESTQQRHRAIVNAYAKISKETIKEIKRIYKQDFILFDYSDVPPF